MAFAVLVVVLATALIGFTLLEKDDEEGRPAPSPAGTLPTGEEDLSLTDAEAIDQFKELDRLRIEAIERRDETLARSIYVDDSPAEKRAVRDIAVLKRRGVRVKTDFETESLTLTANDGVEIRLTQRVVLEAEFLDRQGREVGTARRPERQTIRWVLTIDGGRWLIKDALVVDAQLLPG